MVISPIARLLVVFTPASSVSEAFFRQAGEPAGDASQLPPPPNPERFVAAVGRTGLKVLGPPPFASQQSAVTALGGTHR